MDRKQAGMIVARIHAHFPSVASNDLAAEDWVNLVSQYPFEQGAEIMGLLTTGWTKDRAPRIADWQETARQVAERRNLDRPSLEPVRVQRDDRVAALIRETRDRLASKARRCNCLGCEARRGRVQSEPGGEAP